MRKLWPLALLLAACGAQDVGAGLDPLRLTATSLPPAYLGEPYSASLAAEGGVRPYSFTLDGKLPEGLSFQGGRLFGVPKEKGSFPLLLTVEDAAKNSRAQRLTLTVSDPPPPRLALVLPRPRWRAPSSSSPGWRAGRRWASRWRCASPTSSPTSQASKP